MKKHIETPGRSRAFRPNCYRVLDHAKINTLHSARLEIMERTGMRFFDQGALDLFKKAGARITDGNIVHIPPKLVERARSTVPENVNIYDRNGELAMEVGGDRT